MKKTILLLLLLFALQATNAQRYFQPELYIGPKGGIAYSDLKIDPKTFDQNYHQSNVMGVSLVYYSSIHWGMKWGLNVELSRVEKGWVDLWGDKAQNQYTRHISYWEIPIFTQTSFGFRNWRFLLNFGPVLNFASGGTETIPTEPTFIAPTYYSRPIDNKFQFGVGGGVGFARLLPFGRIQVDARAGQNLISVFEFDRTHSISSQHRYYELSATLLVRLFGNNKKSKPIALPTNQVKPLEKPELSKETKPHRKLKAKKKPKPLEKIK